MNTKSINMDTVRTLAGKGTKAPADAQSGLPPITSPYHKPADDNKPGNVADDGGDKGGAWHGNPVDLFSDVAVPEFPLHLIPGAISTLARECSAQSGLDRGAYAFACLVTCANTIDHRVKVRISSTFKQPPVLWGGLADNSGGGKSALISMAAKPSYDINDGMIEASSRTRARWVEQCKAAKAAKEDPPPEPAWRQRNVLDITVEELGHVLVSNPEGVNYFYDEITEFIGRMDAYSGNAGGKDRGTYLRAYDGGSTTINRRMLDVPMIVPNFSVGILAGIQYEKLAQLFKQRGSGADGMYQRFLCYAFAQAGEIDLCADMGEDTLSNYAALVRKIHEWNGSGEFLGGVDISHDVRVAMQKYMNDMRTIANRTASPRLREHLSRFGGFASRLLLALHVTECAAKGRASHTIEIDTFNRTHGIMAVMYRHAEFVYGKLDGGAASANLLAKSAGEFILSAKRDQIKRGDLTRNATYWRDAASIDAEAAIDLLIEFGWLMDITPPATGRRGRRSDGWFAVNPAVHEAFKEHGQRIKAERTERFAAIQRAAGTRGGN